MITIWKRVNGIKDVNEAVFLRALNSHIRRPWEVIENLHSMTDVFIRFVCVCVCLYFSVLVSIERGCLQGSTVFLIPPCLSLLQSPLHTPCIHDFPWVIRVTKGTNHTLSTHLYRTCISECTMYILCNYVCIARTHTNTYTKGPSFKLQGLDLRQHCPLSGPLKSLSSKHCTYNFFLSNKSHLL